MAWPPADWERAPSAWRSDVWAGPEPFMPYLAPAPPPTPPVATPVAAAPVAGAGLMRELLETFALAIIIFLGIRMVVQNYRIEGTSMEPNLHPGQYLLVNKIAYMGTGRPQRGDVIVFNEWNGDKDFIKRVIGLPGEVVEIRAPDVYINGNKLEEPYLNQPTNGPPNPTTLAPNTYWVLGDNRGNSSDSRSNGPMPRKNIVGKAWFTYWPRDEIGIIQDGSRLMATQPVP